MFEYLGIILCLSSVLIVFSNDCDPFTIGVCPLTSNNVVFIRKTTGDEIMDEYICQYYCFQNKICNNFTYFKSQEEEINDKCILFHSCSKTDECRNCVSGPPSPPMKLCKTTNNNKDFNKSSNISFLDILNQMRNGKQLNSDDENELLEVEGLDENILTKDAEKILTTDDDNGTLSSDDTTIKPEESEKDSDELFKEDYFTQDNNENELLKEDNYCMIGGIDMTGPLVTISHMIRNSSPLLPQLPSFLPISNNKIYGDFYNESLITCSPGLTEEVILPPIVSLIRPGQCIRLQKGFSWTTLGEQMSTYRQGASFVRLGKFLISSGGRSSSTLPLNSIEVLNLSDPKQWKILPKFSLKQPTSDHCSVSLNKTSMMITGGFGQESESMIVNMKNKKIELLPNLNFPRREHACMMIKMNNKVGVIIVGGSAFGNPSMNSVEFMELNNPKWNTLGRLREGRRFPGIFVLEKRLFIAGGEKTNNLGKTIILNNIELLENDGSWREISQKLGERRSRFAAVRVPKRFLN